VKQIGKELWRSFTEEPSMTEVDRTLFDTVDRLMVNRDLYIAPFNTLQEEVYNETSS
jgi:hypothetical protein